ncbi:MAG: endonuclease/exonuclease/phosphatase family protein [Saprospiraceae bacterium]
MTLLFNLLLACLLHAIPANEYPSFRVMSWNIRYDNPLDGPDAWSLRRERVCGLIRYQAPEIFGIQEGLEQQVKYLQTELQAYGMVGVGRDDGKSAGEYCALFYRKDRFKALDSGTFWLSPSPEIPSKGWDAALNRICTYAVLKDLQSGKEIVVFNTHFDHVGETARLRSAQLLLEKINAIKPTGRAALLLGDLNTEPESAPIQTLAQSMRDARKACQTAPYGPEGTFNGFRPATAPLGNRIDYVFVQQLTVLQYAVLSEQELGRYPSDHLPVLAVLQL